MVNLFFLCYDMATLKLVFLCGYLRGPTVYSVDGLVLCTNADAFASMPFEALRMDYEKRALAWTRGKAFRIAPIAHYAGNEIAFAKYGTRPKI